MRICWRIQTLASIDNSRNFVTEITILKKRVYLNDRERMEIPVFGSKTCNRVLIDWRQVFTAILTSHHGVLTNDCPTSNQTGSIDGKVTKRWHRRQAPTTSILSKTIDKGSFVRRYSGRRTWWIVVKSNTLKPRETCWRLPPTRSLFRSTESFRARASCTSYSNSVQTVDLFCHLSRTRRVCEDRCRSYFAEILLAIEHLYHMISIYRDLKPKNIFLDLEETREAHRLPPQEKGHLRQSMTRRPCVARPSTWQKKFLTNTVMERPSTRYRKGALTPFNKNDRTELSERIHQGADVWELPVRVPDQPVFVKL